MTRPSVYWVALSVYWAALSAYGAALSAYWGNTGKRFAHALFVTRFDWLGYRFSPFSSEQWLEFRRNPSRFHPARLRWGNLAPRAEASESSFAGRQVKTVLTSEPRTWVRWSRGGRLCPTHR